jgi:hypothetical protein
MCCLSNALSARFPVLTIIEVNAEIDLWSSKDIDIEINIDKANTTCTGHESQKQSYNISYGPHAINSLESFKIMYICMRFVTGCFTK